MKKSTISFYLIFAGKIAKNAKKGPYLKKRSWKISILRLNCSKEVTWTYLEGIFHLKEKKFKPSFKPIVLQGWRNSYRVFFNLRGVSVILPMYVIMMQKLCSNVTLLKIIINYRNSWESIFICLTFCHLYFHK